MSGFLSFLNSKIYATFVAQLKTLETGIFAIQNCDIFTKNSDIFTKNCDVVTQLLHSSKLLANFIVRDAVT